MSTKIIHILKNDKAEDVLEDFKKTDAKEVILIFPNKSKFGQKEIDFTNLKMEAEKTQKTVTILAMEPHIKHHAQKNNFQFVDIPVKPKPVSSDIDPKIEEVEEEAPHDENIHHKEPDYPEDEKAEEDKESNDYLPDINPIFPENNQEAEEHEIRGELVVKKFITDIVSSKESKTLPIKGGQGERENIEISSIGEPLRNDNEALEDIWLNKKKAKLEVFRFGKFNKNLKKNLFIIFATAAIIVFLITYTTTGKAEITIIPRTQDINFDIDTSASNRYSKIDLAFNAVPGEYFSVEVSDSITRQTTGQKEVAQKASGDITIFNKQNVNQTLVATTRFESPDGLIFRIPNTITIPANSNIVSKVIADKAGETYNIGLADFTVPGLKGTPRFDKVYAKSDTAIKGGIIGLANVITEQDFNKAKDELNSKISNKIKQEFNKSLPNLEIINPIEPKIISEESSHKIEEATTEFTITIKAEIKTVAFRKEDILDLAEQFIQKTGNLILVRDTINLTYSDASLNVQSKTLDFKVNIKGTAAAKIDNLKLAQVLAGKKQNNIKEIISSSDKIKTVKIKLVPFWIKKIPKDLEKINIKTQY